MINVHYLDARGRGHLISSYVVPLYFSWSLSTEDRYLVSKSPLLLSPEKSRMSGNEMR